MEIDNKKDATKNYSLWRERFAQFVCVDIFADFINEEYPRFDKHEFEAKVFKRRLHNSLVQDIPKYLLEQFIAEFKQATNSEQKQKAVFLVIVKNDFEKLALVLKKTSDNKRYDKSILKAAEHLKNK